MLQTICGIAREGPRELKDRVRMSSQQEKQTSVQSATNFHRPHPIRRSRNATKHVQPNVPPPPTHPPTHTEDTVPRTRTNKALGRLSGRVDSLRLGPSVVNRAVRRQRSTDLQARHIEIAMRCSLRSARSWCHVAHFSRYEACWHEEAASAALR